MADRFRTACTSCGWKSTWMPYRLRAIPRLMFRLHAKRTSHV